MNTAFNSTFQWAICYKKITLLFRYCLIFLEKKYNRPSSLGQTSDLKKRLEVLDLPCRLMIR